MLHSEFNSRKRSQCTPPATREPTFTDFPLYNDSMLSDAILIHGWDPNFYNSKIKNGSPDGIAWSHRSEFIEELSKRYNLKYYNLPGFAGTPEPDMKEYDVEDYSKDFAKWKKINSPNAKLIIGYSFGGAVALVNKALMKDPTPTILISPAIMRGESMKSEIGGGIKKFVPNIIENQLKHLYQLLMSRYYREGTPFLRKTYNIIVRRDLRYLLDKINPNELLLIYGENDTDTSWKLVEKIAIKNSIGHHIIQNGQHNIGQTNPIEIIKQIDGFITQ